MFASPIIQTIPLSVGGAVIPAGLFAAYSVLRGPGPLGLKSGVKNKRFRGKLQIFYWFVPLSDCWVGAGFVLTTRLPADSGRFVLPRVIHGSLLPALSIFMVLLVK